ncbi:MAG: hypothetical protein AAFN00_03360 [Cyanobacteria bacterium J06558_2]
MILFPVYNLMPCDRLFFNSCQFNVGRSQYIILNPLLFILFFGKLWFLWQFKS